MGDRGVLDIDSVFLAKIPKGKASESFARAGDDPVGHTEVMCNISGELCRFF
jgi:hypothetical protein